MPHLTSLRRAASFALLLTLTTIGSLCRAQADPPGPFLHPLTDNMVWQRGKALTGPFQHKDSTTRADLSIGQSF